MEILDEQVARPLQAVADKANKVLLKEAHDLLFAAEKTTLTNLTSPLTDQETKDVEDSLSVLKDILLDKTLRPSSVRGAVDTLRGKHKILEQKVETLRLESVAEEERMAGEKLAVAEEALDAAEIVDDQGQASSQKT